jgi:hypothetical protein
MENNKNYFDQMLDMQNQFVNSMTEASKKMMETVQPGKQGEMSVPGQELFSDYYKKQQQLMEEAMGMKDPKEFMEKAPEQFNKFLEVQNEFITRFFQQYQEYMDKMGIKPMVGDNKVPELMADSFVRFNKTIMEANNQAQQNMKNFRLPDMGSNMVPQMKNFMDAYNQMYQFWEPMQRFIQNGVSQPEALKTFLSPEAYRKVMDSLFGFNPTEGMQKMLETNNKLFNEFAEQFQKMTGQSGEMTNEMIDRMRQMARPDVASMLNMVMDVYKRIQKAYSPFTMVFTQGQEGQAVTKMRDAQYDFASFLIKSAELQQKFYEAGQSALPKAIKGMNERFMSEKKMPSYEEFFNYFIDTIEQDVEEVIQSDEYANLQGEVSRLGMSVKSAVDESMEMMFNGLPFVTRTEADDMAEELHSLREKVREMEDKVEDTGKSASTAKKSTTTSSSKSSSTTKKSGSTTTAE